MSGYELCTFIGNLGKDGEMRYLPNGTPVTSFSVAVNSDYKKNGELVKKMKWVHCSIFGKLAEAVTQYLTKGRQVLVTGELQADKETGGPRMYDRQDGTKGTSFELHVATLKLLDSKLEAGNSEAASATGKEIAEELGGESIPF